MSYQRDILNFFVNFSKNEFMYYVHVVFNAASLPWPKQDYFEGRLAMPQVYR